jgi:hypothetical protein
MSHTTSVKSCPIKSITALQAAVQTLRLQGVECVLKQNSVPRMFYDDQISRHVRQREEELKRTGKDEGYVFHTNPEECDYTLHLPKASYDVGFLRNRKGELVPFFDDWKQSVASQLGATFGGKVEHWSGDRDAGEQQLHSVGKLLQQYAKHAATEAAVSDGYMVTGEETDAQGNIHLLVEVM